MRAQVILRLLARPSHRVDAGINYQPCRAKALTRELPELVQGIFKQSKLRSQRLRIQGPTFGIRAVAIKLAKVRQPFL